MKKVAVIPARQGSKRLPGKNIREFCGKPLISYSIKAAIDSNMFSRVVVSTDSLAISNVAQEWGAEVPFIRPAHLSDDHTPIGEVFEH
ncbi:MAG: pseudaminic acid cytidylyltransferase, partial [Pseudomonadota bacterium]|nr:pseudaminic acid cytidylyltransferase [Pseudomonadota bacterium]